MEFATSGRNNHADEAAREGFRYRSRLQAGCDLFVEYSKPDVAKHSVIAIGTFALTVVL